MASEENGGEKKEDTSQDLQVHIEAVVQVSYIDPPKERTESAGREALAPQEKHWVRQALINFSPVITTIATAVIMGATICYTLYAGRQWGTMQQQLELSERPWVSVDLRAVRHLTFEENGMSTTLQFALKNTGHSPAKDAQIELWAFPVTPSHNDLIAKQKELCEGMRQLAGPVSDFGAYTLFPGDAPLELEMDTGIGQENITKALAETPGWGGIQPAIVGCVDYLFEFAEGHHQTGFAYYLFHNDPANPHSNFFDPHPGMFPAEHLRFVALPRSHKAD